MALVSGRSSALNPNAPLFIPAALRQVEDFSPKWWELVQSSIWFRDYWLSQHKEEDFEESGNDYANNDFENVLSETFDLGIEEDFGFLENEFEQLMMSSEAQDSKAQDDPNEGVKTLQSDHSKNTKAILNILTPTSPKGKGPKSPVGFRRHLEKPAQRVNIKYAPQRIHQPR